MRTIKHIPDSFKQKRIAKETLDIYVPWPKEWPIPN